MVTAARYWVTKKRENILGKDSKHYKIRRVTKSFKLQKNINDGKSMLFIKSMIINIKRLKMLVKYISGDNL